MCGIVGFQGKFSSTVFDNAVSAIAHRGPDDHGMHLVGSTLGLGHTRLSILDTSHLGHQPMIDEDRGNVLVFNGEIYNFQEIRNDLIREGERFNSSSDTEVLLKLYGRAGEKMLPRLNGIFALAIWDPKRSSIFIARDALGVKPVYYKESNAGFAFSSEIKSLMHFFSSAGVLDIASVERYLTFLWCPGEGTPLADVKKLPPGEAMTVKNGKIENKWVWYTLPSFRTRPTKMSRQHAIKDTEKHLRQAVHRQLVSDVPVGAFLSGGLDSSAIVAFAREQNPDIRCFTIEATGTDEEGIADDLPYARRVAAHLNVPLDVVRIDAARMAEDLPAMVAQLDEPLADPAPLNVLYISRLAREQGIKVLLSGAGGDDLFTGYRRHLAVMSEGTWSWLPRPVRTGIEQITCNLDQGKPLFRRLRKLFNGATLNGDERLVNYFRWVDRRDLISLYTPEFRAALGDAHAEDPMLTFLAALPPQTSRLERMLALEQRFFLTDHNLTYTDKMSMAAGVEVRVPFLDLDLVEFAAGVPARFKQRGSQGKWVLKKAMESYLPRDVIYRPKSGFGAPLRHWMRVELRDLLADVLGEQSLQKRGLFEPVSVHKLIAANDQGKIDASYTLLALMCIELWCRRFVDQTVAVIDSDFEESVL